MTAMHDASKKLALSFLVMAISLTGCLFPQKPQSSSDNLLNPPRLAANSSDLDVFFITLPEQAAAEAFEDVWNQADAQQISTGTRQAQYQNGMRAAVLGWRLPPALQHMIEQQSQPLTLEHNAVGQQARPDNMMTPFDLDKMDRVSIRRIVALPNKRNEIIISRSFEEFPLLLVQDGEISGGNYENAQGVFAVRATPVSGGKVRFEIDPELQYGESEQSVNTTPGIFKLTHSRQKVSLDQMAFACDLVPGEFLVIGTQPGRPGSVGDRFFEDKSAGESRRKLLLIRLARAPGSELFGGLPAAATVSD